MEQTSKKEVLGAHTEIYANRSKGIRICCILQQKEETVSDIVHITRHRGVEASEELGSHVKEGKREKIGGKADGC